MIAQATCDDNKDELLDLELIHIEEDQHRAIVTQALKTLPEALCFHLRRVFRQCLESQHEKIAASGMDLGSDMIFGTRLGFSGTPNDLLPLARLPPHPKSPSIHCRQALLFVVLELHAREDIIMLIVRDTRGLCGLYDALVAGPRGLHIRTWQFRADGADTHRPGADGDHRHSSGRRAGQQPVDHG